MTLKEKFSFPVTRGDLSRLTRRDKAYYRQQRQLCGRSARTGRWRSTAEAGGTIRTCPAAAAALPRRLPQLPPRYDRFNRITARRRPPSASAFLDRRSKCLPLGAKLCCNSHFGRVLDPWLPGCMFSQVVHNTRQILISIVSSNWEWCNKTSNN